MQTSPRPGILGTAPLGDCITGGFRREHFESETRKKGDIVESAQSTAAVNTAYKQIREKRF